MTSTRLRRSSISLARNIGSGLYSLKETLMTSSMQAISEGCSPSPSSTFYITDNEEVTEDENDDNLQDKKGINMPEIKLSLPPSIVQNESDNFSALFESSG